MTPTTEKRGEATFIARQGFNLAHGYGVEGAGVVHYQVYARGEVYRPQEEPSECVLFIAPSFAYCD